MLTPYRFVVMLHALREIPYDSALAHTYSLEYTLFGKRVKYSLDLQFLQVQSEGSPKRLSTPEDNDEQLIDSCELPLNCIRLFYFFAGEHKNVKEFLEEQ
jgi:hypothetical protein